MADFIIVVVLLVIVAAAVSYIVKAKKSGAKCIGCPVEGGCANKHNGASGCSCSCGSESKSENSCCCHENTK